MRVKPATLDTNYMVGGCSRPYDVYTRCVTTYLYMYFTSANIVGLCFC